jgi:uncharacterized protein (DUF433 family)
VEINWTESPDIEIVAGRCAGRPTIKGTRIEPDVILVEEKYGRTPEQTHASFPTVPVDTIRRIRDFAHQHQPVH